MIAVEPSRHGKRGPDRQPRKRRGSVPNPAVIAMRERTERARREEAADPERFPELLRRYFDFDPMPFHSELIHQMFMGGRWVVNLPTDHGKSICTSYLFPILSLMNEPDESHIICGANENDSKSWVQTIQRALEGFDPNSAALIADYPWIAKPKLDVKHSWSTRTLTVAGRTRNNRNPSVLAVGAGSADIRGRRGKLIMDDIEGQKHRNSPRERALLMDWIKLECVRCFEDVHESDRPLLLACGTPFDVDSIYFSLERTGWEVLRRMVFTDPQPWRSSNPSDHKDSMLWPAKYAKVQKQWKDLNKSQFSIAYLMDPTEGNPNRLTIQQIEALTANANEPGAESKTFVSLDAASGSSQGRADYAGLAVVKINWPRDDKLPEVKVLRAVASRDGLFEQIHLAAELAHGFGTTEGGVLRPLEVIYEVDGLGAVYGNAFQHLAPQLRLIRSRTRDYRFDTEMGITIIRTLVRDERLKIPIEESESEGMTALKAEIRDLGGAGHDHISAAIWFVVRWLYAQVRGGGLPRVVNGWGAPAVLQRRDYVDREPLTEAQVAAPVNGWAPITPYRRFNR